MTLTRTSDSYTLVTHVSTCRDDSRTDVTCLEEWAHTCVLVTIAMGKLCPDLDLPITQFAFKDCPLKCKKDEARNIFVKETIATSFNLSQPREN